MEYLDWNEIKPPYTKDADYAVFLDSFHAHERRTLRKALRKCGMNSARGSV